MNNKNKMYFDIISILIIMLQFFAIHLDINIEPLGGGNMSV